MARPLDPPVDGGGGGTGTGGGSGTGSNANVIKNSFTVNSGLFDQTPTQYPIQFAPGVPSRVFRYVGPLVSLTDTFSGHFTLSFINGLAGPVNFTVTLTSKTLDGWASAIN